MLTVSLTITAAQHGGFVVWSDPRRDVHARELLFAGSLPDCLEFMRQRLSDLPPPVSDIRMAA